MKKHIITLTIITFSIAMNAQKSYNDLWEKVHQFEIENLPKSANAIVTKIAQQAEKDHNTPQIIKCLIYQSKFLLTLEEDAQFKIINNLKAKSTQGNTLQKRVTQNILAKLYWDYFQQNRWKFYDRTKTQQKVNPNDFRTWDLTTLFHEIHHYYNLSLQDKEQLQATPIISFEDIIKTHHTTKIYEPTLYDFLAQNALKFYKTDENTIHKPNLSFEIKNPKLLGTNETFSNISLPNNDTYSLQLNALKIYQELTKFHLKKGNQEALTNITLQRLNFVLEKASFYDKEETYFNTLTKLKEANAEHFTSGIYAYEIAKTLYQKGKTFKNSPKNQFKKKEALDICSNIIDKFPSSEGASKCKNLKEIILTKKIEITNEAFVPTHKYSKLLIKYQNIDRLNFSIYQISQKELQKFEKTTKENQQKLIKKLNLIKNFNSSLKNEKDYQQHSTEIICPKLAQGTYLIVAKTTKKLSNEIYGTSLLSVTDLTLIKNKTHTGIDFYLLDRNTGKPISDAKVTLSNEKNRYQYYQILSKKFKTDQNGRFSFNNLDNQYGNVSAKVIHKGKTTVFNHIYINNYRVKPNSTKTSSRIFLFTDRSIYRPGQTIHFKGIAIEKNDTKSTLLTHQKINIELLDTNYQKIKSLNLKTNDYGSFSSSFVLPKHVLTGNFILRTRVNEVNNSQSISVEEYKRPKFEVSLNTTDKSYKINDTITVKVSAKSFSGVQISNAKGSYNVYRKTTYPNWWFWNYSDTKSPHLEIANGKINTNDKGEFVIKFKAIGKQDINQKAFPVFEFEVSADIIDVNGETISQQKTIRIGYHSINTDIKAPEIIYKNNKKTVVTINTTNLDNEFAPAKGKLMIYKLISPKRPIRKRTWKAPDYPTISKIEFNQKFPFDAYKNEDNYRKWDKGELVFSKVFDTKKSKEIILKNLKKWKSGKYIAEIANVNSSSEIRTSKTFFTLVKNQKECLSSETIHCSLNKKEYIIGETAKLFVSTKLNNVRVAIFIEKNSKIVNHYFINLNKNHRTINIPIDKKDVGGFGIHYFIVKNNEFKKGNILVTVPYPKTELDIITKTFRNKLTPNQKETWSFQIKTPYNKKASAEVLASMYDTSLDKFKNHNWHFSPINKPLYYIKTNSNASGFENRMFNIKNISYHSYYNHHQPQSEFNWFGFSFVGNTWMNQEYLKLLKHKPILKSGKFTGKITGTVSDLQGVLPGVNITIGDKGVESDVNGRYSIIAKKGDMIEFSFVGTESVKVEVGDFSKLDIVLFTSNQLDEVVVTGAASTMMKGITSGEEYEEVEDVPENTKADSSLQAKKKSEKPQIRKNLNETAFFYPKLKTDKNGNISFSFDTPEALTSWKVQLLAHTKELYSSVKKLEAITQKKLMVTPNMPRFVRQGDTIILSTKISNLSSTKLQGKVAITLSNSITGEKIVQKTLKEQVFEVATKGSTKATWKFIVPENIDAITYKIVAQTDNFSDGEQNTIPVLSNSILVTESLPIWVNNYQTKNFKLRKLINQKEKNSATLRNHKLTLEISSNPSWYAIQALPYLLEDGHENSERLFACYYANTLASYIVNSQPKIKEIFDNWKSSDALISNLEKNSELKTILLEETPWVRDAQSETAQKKRIALLFEQNNLKNDTQYTIQKLAESQLSNGGFTWFKGAYRPNPTITNYIISGFGHLKQLGVVKPDNKTQQIITKGIYFLDNEIYNRYTKLVSLSKKEGSERKAAQFLSKKHIGYFELNYLYTRSFFKENTLSSKNKVAFNYFKQQAEKYWNDFNLYGKGLIAIAQYRDNNTYLATKILNSLKENSINSEELGMYWKENTQGWYWHQAPIETQALLIEIFTEIENDTTTVNALKKWLLKNKQVSHWKTSKATVDAIYALLIEGTNWISNTSVANVKLGNTTINPTETNSKVEAGTGYFKQSWLADSVKPEMGNVTIQSTNKQITWGALYWQYFENIDNVNSSETGLAIHKKIFKQTYTSTGKELVEITDNDSLNIGDIITVRIELSTHRNLEFIHLKDMRPSGCEPLNTVSQHKWQDGLSYYESTKDTATHFFFDYLRRGIYVFEYDIRVNNSGNFSSGISTIENMYAPAFRSNSNGFRISVK